MTKLSVALIVKNEEKLLAKCLESVKEANEIIVVDTGSSDKTIEIAKQFTDKVFTDYKWNDNFAEARNHANSKCTGDWILVLDADEELEPNGIEKIRKEIEKTNKRTINVFVHSNKTNFYFPRVFRNIPEIYWKGAVHNHLSLDDGDKSDIKIKFGYSPAHKKDPDRALRILEKEVKRDPTLVREKYYLGREYYYRHYWGKSIDALKDYLKEDSWAPQRADGYFLLATCYWNSNQGEKARDACLQAIKINTNFKQAIELMAEMSGPINKKRWLDFAQGADNSNVLFVRGEVEKGADYYNELFKKDSNMSRYEEIYREVGKLSKGKVLDIGCGTGKLAKYIKNYSGFDFSQKAVEIANNDKVWGGNAYDKENYGDYDTYIALEVFEHLDDLKVLDNIPKGKRIIFSVPSFKDPSHLRTYTEEIVRKRYQGKIKIEQITRFNWGGKWIRDGTETNNYILLVEGIII